MGRTQSPPAAGACQGGGSPGWCRCGFSLRSFRAPRSAATRSAATRSAATCSAVPAVLAMLHSQRAIGLLASAIDRMATTAVRLSRPSSRPIDEERIALLEKLAELYEGHAAHFFPAPSPIEPLIVRTARAWDVSWASPHRPLESSLEAELASYMENGSCHVRLRSRPGEAGAPRPVVVFIHGYLAGAYDFEERIWPLERLDVRGFDTALFTLPFHGLRSAPELRRNPPFPGRDAALNIETFRQAVCDLRDFFAWLRSKGHPAVGLVGMSLGGYTAALTATVEPELDFLVPVIPLACLADFARDQGHLPAGTRGARRYEAGLRRAYAAVSPCSRTPLIEGRRVLVIGARADRITRVEHARRLAHHFSAPLYTWPGGHLLQWGRSEAFARMEAHLLDCVRGSTA